MSKLQAYMPECNFDTIDWLACLNAGAAEAAVELEAIGLQIEDFRRLGEHVSTTRPKRPEEVRLPVEEFIAQAKR